MDVTGGIGGAGLATCITTWPILNVTFIPLTSLQKTLEVKTICYHITHLVLISSGLNLK